MSPKEKLRERAMTIELTDRERDVLRIIVDEKRDLLGRYIRVQQEKLKIRDLENRDVIVQNARSEQRVWNELRAISEKLNK